MMRKKRSEQMRRIWQTVVSAGEDMAAVAEEMGQESTDATFDEEDTAPNEELIAAVNAFTTEGECTEPIESEGGIYVAQLTSLLDREATDQEKSNIIADRQQEQYDLCLKSGAMRQRSKWMKKCGTRLIL